MDSGTSSSDSDELFPIVNNWYQLYQTDDLHVYQNPLPLSMPGVLRAIVEEDLEKVKCMVESGNSLNVNDDNGNTPFHVAVIKNNLEILEYLLSQEDILINIRNFRGETPLFQAVEGARYESTKKLIQAGANVNLSNYGDVTPLHASVIHPDIAHLLLLNGADIDAVDFSGETPLHEAIGSKCLETVCMFLYYNADANAADSEKITPFMKALMSENIEIQQALFEYVDDFNLAAEDHTTTLEFALRHDTPYVEEIIRRGADVNYSDYYSVEQNVSCVFMLCLLFPNHKNFKLIWEKLNYNHKTNYINLCALFKYLQRPQLEKYVEIITVCDNIKVAVDSLYGYNNFSHFIYEFSRNNFDLEQLTKLTCRLLLGGYRTTTHEIYAIFSEYGYCQLFKILLYMENNYDYGWLPGMILPRMIIDVDFKFNILTNKTRRIFKHSYELLREYSACSSVAIYSPLCQYMEIYLIPKVPSLIEIARNKAREYIAQAYKTTNSCQFYTAINHLNILPVYKQILTFEKKLYRIRD